MASKCPNKQSKEWQKLVNNLGETAAYKVFLANNEEVPEMSVIDDIISNYKSIPLSDRSTRPSILKDRSNPTVAYPESGTYSEQQRINIAKKITKWNNNPENNIRYKFIATPFGSNSYKIKYVELNKPVKPSISEPITRLDFYKGDQALMDQEEGPLYEQRVDYALKLINGLQKLQRNKFTSDKLQGWINDLQKQGIPKEQIEFFKEAAKDGMTKDEIIASILANYSYTVEINTAKGYGSMHSIQNDFWIEKFEELVEDSQYMDMEGNWFSEPILKITHNVMNTEGGFVRSFNTELEAVEYIKELNKNKPNSSYYFNLSAPGGTGRNKYEGNPDWEYQELEIATPLITPSIKGHAQFATEHGIGWARVWYNKKTGVVEIQEIQSDLFQKDRNKKDLINSPDLVEFKDGEILTTDKGTFKLLNRSYNNGNYVFTLQNTTTGQVGTITREKLLSGIKALQKNQFLQLLNKDNNWVTFFIKSIIQDSAKKGYEKVLFPKGETAAKVEGHESIAEELDSIDYELRELDGQLEDYNTLERREELNKRKQELKSQGIEKLKPIEAFYEIKVGNILEKLFGKNNVKTITDEYSNQWREIEIKSERDLKNIELQRRGISDRLQPEVREDFEKKKEIMMKVFPFVEEVIEDYNMPQVGLVEAGGRIIRVNPSLWTKDTLGHEFAHILIDTLGGITNPLVENAIKLLVDSNIWNNVKERYPDLYENDINKFKEEVLAQALGEETVVLYDESKLPQWLRVLKQLIRRIMQICHIGTPKEVTDIAKIIISDAVVSESGDIQFNEMRDQRTAKEYLDEVVNNIESEKGPIKKIRDSALHILRTKSKLYSRKYQKSNVKSIESAITEIENLDKNPIEAVKRYIKFADKQTNLIYHDYLNKKDPDKFGTHVEIQMKHLSRWHTYINGFNNIEELSSLSENILNYYLKEGKLLDVKDISQVSRESLQQELGLSEINDKTLEVIKELFITNKNILTRISDRKTEITKFYLEQGKKIVVNFLLPHSNVIIANMKERYDLDYNKLSKAEKKLISRQAYISEHLKQDKEAIEIATRDSLNKEIEKASRDVSVLTRWIDNLLDSPDIVVSAMVKAHQDAMFKSSLAKNQLKYEVLNTLRKLEKVLPMTTTADYQKIFDFMLERDENKQLTGNIIDKWKSSMWEARDAFREQLNNADWTDKRFLQTLKDRDYLWKKSQIEDILSGKLSISDAIDICMRGWTNINCPMTDTQKKQFDKAKDQFFEEAVATGKMRADDVTIIKDTVYDVIRGEKNLEELVPYDVYIYYTDWVKSNIWKYRDVLDIWKNPQYETLMKLPLTDPRREFYDFIINKLTEIQPKIPYSYRLNQHLPGVIKNAMERITSSTNTAKDVVKYTLKDAFNVMADDVTRGGEEISDELGNRLLFVPIYYTKNLREEYKEKFEQLPEPEQNTIIDQYRVSYNQQPISYKNSVSLRQYAINKESNKDLLKNQSFDLGGIYYKYFASATDFIHKNEILAEMEMAKYLVENRQVYKTSGGLPILGKKTGEIQLKKPGESNIAAQLKDWFEAEIYGIKEVDKAKIFNNKVDVGKLANLLGRYTSLNLLAVNFVQSTANIIFGETTQLIESLGGSYFSPADLTSARGYYFSNIMGIINDIGLRQPRHLVNLLNLEFDTLNEYDDGNFRKKSRFSKLLSSSTLFFTTHIGEHFMQTAVMLAMLKNVRATKGGKDIGSMLDFANVVDGRLVFTNKEGITPDNFGKEERAIFSQNIKRVLSSMHGEYSEAGRVAIQRYAAGRLAIMFRKFIVPGFNRRYGRKRLNNLLAENVEGYHRTTARFIKNLFQDLKLFKWSLASEEWNALTSKEKANIRKSLAEVGFMVASFILASACMTASKEGNAGDDDWLLEFLTYQSLRYRAELWFFANPAETLKIMNSPLASMSVAENTIKLAGQIFDPLEKYERGNWKGHYKIEKTLINYMPVIKQIYRLKYVDDQSSWLKN